MAKNSMQMGLRFDGVKNLLEAISETLPRELAAQAYGSALKSAAKPMVRAAKKEALRVKDTGLLAESITSKVHVYKRKGKAGQAPKHEGAARLWVGAGTGFKRLVLRPTKRKGEPPSAGKHLVRANPSKYSHLVEFGTSTAAAKPFMRPALSASSAKAEAALAKALEQGLKRAVENARKKGDRL